MRWGTVCGLALLRRDLPTFVANGGPLGGTFSDDLAEMIAWSTQLDHSYVAVQGPPGTGKTYSGAHLVRALTKSGSICQPLSIEVHSRSGVKMSSKANHVVVFVQENHTTDNYFRSLAAWGANVATGWPTATNPPAKDQPHDRHAYARWLAAQQAGTATPAFRAQFDTTAVLPFYAYLAATGAFLENHCSGFGTNSTPNHLLIVGGQSPTLRNPPRSAPQPEWDMPSLPGHAADHGLTWTCYTGTSGYPVEFYTQLKGSPNIVRHDRIGADAANLPALSMVWHDSPYDEHPAADITLGHNQIWTDVAAVAAAGHWDDTVFLLTWDDWGGYDDHVVTPNVEHTPDGVQLAYGPRVPLLIFGGPVTPGIDTRWNSHVSIPKTVLDLLGLPPLGVPRVDDAPSLADLVDSSVSNPPPPAFGTTITQPTPPTPTPAPAPPPPPPTPHSLAVGAIVLRDGITLPPPDDQPITAPHPVRHRKAHLP